MSWFINLSVATCHILLSLCQFVSREKGQNTRSPPFSYDTKIATDGYCNINLSPLFLDSFYSHANEAKFACE